MCLYSSNVVEPMTRSSPAVSSGLISVAEIHRAAGRRAGADGRVDLVDEEDRLRPLRERRDDGLEALLEVAAEARAREQRAGVEREDFRVLQRLLDIVGQQPRGEPFGHRGLADAGLADEHRVVLAAAAEHFDACAGARRSRPISGSSAPPCRARSVRFDAVGARADRAPVGRPSSSPAPASPAARRLVAGRVRGRRHLA